VKKWKEVEGGVLANKLLPEGCAGESTITRVVRKEGSGTTAIMKKYLFLSNKEEILPGKNWFDSGEENPNNVWPDEGEGFAQAEKGSGIAAKVAAEPGTIGYANLNEVRANAAFKPAPGGTGGEGKATFWADLQDNGIGTEKVSAFDPSTNGEAETAANANCKEEVYIKINKEGKEAKFPPSSTEEPWNEVTASTKQKSKKYGLCGFTYDLALTKYSSFAGTSALEVETLKNYFPFMLSAPEQSALEGKDFIGDPVSLKATQNVLLIAQKGAEKVGF
jgi:ABC-type phosphate transport system substrate-binding protein